MRRGGLEGCKPSKNSFLLADWVATPPSRPIRWESWGDFVSPNPSLLYHLLVDDLISMPIAAILFDLDNTLYPASSGLMQGVDTRITEYVQRLLGIDVAAAM